MKSRFGAALEPFTVVRLGFHEKENRELVNFSSAEILKSNFSLNSQVEQSEVLAYWGELVAEFAPPHEADERLFRMLLACIEALAGEGARRAVTRYFEIWLLRLAGLFPDLKSCHECGAPIENSAAAFIDNELRACCKRCGPASGSSLATPVLAAIRSSQKLSPSNFAAAYKLSKSNDAELGDLTHRLISRALERRPRTLFASAR